MKEKIENWWGLKVAATDKNTFQVRNQPAKSVIRVLDAVFWTNDMTGNSPAGFSSMIKEKPGAADDP